MPQLRRQLVKTTTRHD